MAASNAAASPYSPTQRIDREPELKQPASTQSRRGQAGRAAAGRHATGALVAVAWALAPLGAAAADAACTAIDDDALRLVCYDRAAGRIAPAPMPTPAPAASRTEAATPPAPQQVSAQASAQAPPASAPAGDGTSTQQAATTEKDTTLSKIWELDAADKQSPFRLLTYKANYLL
ncbi:MAG: hypothetical protein KDG44_16270, partial [Burkholderiaceae bacterium]|nr:hypothetical protein [Burkholderiaceae bacterium]